MSKLDPHDAYLRMLWTVACFAAFCFVAGAISYAVHLYWENIREGECQSSGKAWIQGSCVPVCVWTREGLE